MDPVLAEDTRDLATVDCSSESGIEAAVSEGPMVSEIVNSSPDG
jgi:hypothetical protein